MAKMIVMGRIVILGRYSTSAVAAIAHDVCLLANGKPQSGRSGCFARPAQSTDLNYLSPADAQPPGVEVPTLLLQTAEKIVDAHKQVVAKAQLNDSSIKVRWLQDLSDAATAKAKQSKTDDPCSTMPAGRPQATRP